MNVSVVVDKKMSKVFDNRVIERFEEKYEPIPEAGCWIWTACSHERGYGLFYTGFNRKKGKMEFAHRVSYEIYFGISPGDRSVCHSCDNPSCVNPNHLFLGSHKENMEDMMNKGRLICASQRIDREGQQKAMRLRKQGYMVKEIAKILGVSSSHASRLSRGLRKHFNEG